ncbi:ETEC_3214 domain-containing protein [Thaumasiovibrio sp. DFM-14]|uniref:ETEC_3214 domain-containing protein n=1 Tax=Thaumasiovibrio sp. DFM-14 TaxID=3384792 RepID=UPI0039A3B16C
MQIRLDVIKAKSAIFYVAAMIVSIGNWNDTEAVLINAYQRVVANWTNTNEYALINRISVGHSYEYVLSSIGLPQAVKTSRIDPDLHFGYFNFDKFLLSISHKNNRITGYAIQALNTEFKADIPYIEGALFTQSNNEMIEYPDDYFFESGNVEYYLDAVEMGRNALFQQVLVGQYNYIPEHQLSPEKIVSLDRGYVLNQKENTQSLKNDLRQQLANTFIVFENDVDEALDMMLTRYEYAMYFL